MNSSVSGDQVAIDGAELALAAISPALQHLEAQIIATKSSQLEMNTKITEMAEVCNVLSLCCCFLIYG